MLKAVDEPMVYANCPNGLTGKWCGSWWTARGGWFWARIDGEDVVMLRRGG